MWWSYILNVGLGVITLITMLFCLGTLEEAISAEVPYLQLFLNTGSQTVAITLTVGLFVIIFSGNITALATTSREAFAFSQTKAFHSAPGSVEMEQKRHVPFNAVYATSFWCCVLCLINLGSTFAFNIIISLSLLALMSTYMLSMGCLLLKRIRGEPLPPARWRLGRFGLPINTFAFFFAAFAIVMSCFPASLLVDTLSANWAPAVWAGVILISVRTYFVHGKKHFTPPVMLVEGKRTGGLQESG